jgi:hypothetical protein
MFCHYLKGNLLFEIFLHICKLGFCVGCVREQYLAFIKVCCNKMYIATPDDVQGTCNFSSEWCVKELESGIGFVTYVT